MSKIVNTIRKEAPQTFDAMVKKKRSIYEDCTPETLLYYLENAIMNYMHRSSKSNLKIMVELEKEVLRRLGGSYMVFEEMETGGRKNE